MRYPQTIEATFDGKSFLPDKPVSLQPNTKVRLTVEPATAIRLAVEPATTESKPAPEDDPNWGSFLRTAASLNLDGPPDWSANVDKYLYGFDEEPSSEHK